MIGELTEEQKQIVVEYQTIFNRLSMLENQMVEIKAEVVVLVDQLETLRTKDKNIFKNYGKK